MYYGSENTLTELLDFARLRDCSDPRDMIYGIQGLCSHPFVDKIRLHYSLSVSQVYNDAFFAQVESSSRLNALCYSDAQESRSADFILPTWVPNWFCKQKFGVSIDHNRRAAGLSEGNYRLIEPQALEIVGVRYGVVYHHTKPMPLERPT